MRVEGGKGVGGDSWRCSGQSSKEGGLSGVGETHLQKSAIRT